VSESEDYSSLPPLKQGPSQVLPEAQQWQSTTPFVLHGNIFKRSF